MFFRKTKELKKLREDYDLIVGSLNRLNSKIDALIERIEQDMQKKESVPEPKAAEITPRQVVNEWFYFKEERMNENGTN